MKSFIPTMIIIVVLLNGCGTPQREVRKMEITAQVPSVISYPSDIRGTYVVKEGSNLKFCAEPVPDIALESIQKLVANIKLTLPQQQTAGVDVASDLTVKAIELAGRTQLLLIAREMLYRACEMSVNHPTQLSDAMEMYRIVIQLVRDLGHAEKTQADANLKKREAELNNAKAALQNALKGGSK